MNAKRNQSPFVKRTRHVKIFRLLVFVLFMTCWSNAQQEKPDDKDNPVCEGAGCETEKDPADADRLSDQGTTRSGVENSKRPHSRHSNPRARKRSTRFLNESKRFVPSPEPLEENEFQRFIFESSGLRLPMYGRDLFERRARSFVSSGSSPVPPDYVVGTGDQLVVRITGQIPISTSAYVDRNGQIFIPKVGAVSVAAVRLQELQPVLYREVSRFFRNFDLSINLARVRGLHVYVVGMAKQPGHYRVSALSTLINALFACGGPGPNGSMRRIELRRSGKLVTQFDLYDFLAHGDGSHDAQLMDGDVIYIPPASGFVALTGSVQQPGVYELPGPTTVGEVLRLAGGLATTADRQRAMLERLGNDRLRHIEQLDLNEAGMATQLQDGDLVRFFPMSPRFTNVVLLRGNVQQPGKYPWHTGMRISDLLPNPDAVIKTKYWRNRGWVGSDHGGWLVNAQYGHQSARNKDTSDPGDGAPGSSKKEMCSRTPRRPCLEHEDYAPNRTTVFTGVSAEINWDYALIQRLNKMDLTMQLLSFNLKRAILQPDSADNLLLQPDDVVTVFSQRDMAVPVEKRAKFVTIEGEVGSAGVYRVQPGETLRDILVRAGGLTPQAYLFATEFLRESTRIEQQNNLERMLSQMEKDLRASTTKVASSLIPKDRQAAQDELEAQKDAIARLRKTHPTGRVVLGLQPSDSTESALPLLPLEDGDRIVVPARSATVSVAGAVYNQNSFLYQDAHSVKDYLRRSGGPTRQADGARMFVIRADGSVISKRMRNALNGKLESLKLMPGDTIVLPDKTRNGGVWKGLRDWSQVFAQFALGAAAINVLQQK